MKRTIINPVIKDTVTFLQTAASSSGRITQLEITLHPGGGNPLHHHSYPEESPPSMASWASKPQVARACRHRALHGRRSRPWFSRRNPTAAQIHGQSREGQWRGATADREVLRLR
jgi:hypothetical protein